nr:MAG TPA: hypothetical protein [Bacteriophage sp.]
MYRCKTVETLLGSSMILPNTPRKLCDSVENPLTKKEMISIWLVANGSRNLSPLHLFQKELRKDVSNSSKHLLWILLNVV